MYEKKEKNQLKEENLDLYRYRCVKVEYFPLDIQILRQNSLNFKYFWSVVWLVGLQNLQEPYGLPIGK